MQLVNDFFLILGEYVRPHSRFKSIIVRQKFNMSLEKNELQETASVLAESSESTDCFNYYNTEHVNITIHQPTGEEGKIKRKNILIF